MKPFSKLRDLLSKSTSGEWTRFNSTDYPGAKDTFGDASATADLITEAHNQLPRVLEALDVAMGALEKIDAIYASDEFGKIMDEALAKIKELSAQTKD